MITKERGKEFQKLYDDIQMRFSNIEMKQEIDRLNNIINELEKVLIEKIKYWEELENDWIKQGFMKFGGEANTKIIFKGILDKLKELKGDSNEKN